MRFAAQRALKQATPKKRRVDWTILLRLVAFALMAFLTGILLWQAYRNLSRKGLICESLALITTLAFYKQQRLLGIEWFNRAASPLSAWKINWKFFFVADIVFLALFPFSMFVHSIGLLPGLLFIFVFAYLWAALAKRPSPEAMLATVCLAIFVWLWGEAGRPGLVVMPIDLPEGRNDLEFTKEGLANALETELQNFGLKGNTGSYSETEPSKILANARLFPDSPWFKGSEIHPASLEGLYASHLVVGTQVEGFPLSSIYHVLRHLRGKPLLEGQVLVASDKSLTLALRRFNFPLTCTTDFFSKEMLNEKNMPKGEGNKAVNELWKLAEEHQDQLRHVQDTLGCFPSVTRRILSWLDIADLPSGGEERIANVTVGSHLQGDERLTAALELAALEAMQRLSTERLALYYDNAGRSQSALSYFKKALPELLTEAANTPLVSEELPRQRLTNALIRIGDYQFTTTGSPEPEYGLAAKLLPNDLLTEARIGYAFLMHERYLEWSGGDLCRDTQKNKEGQELLTLAIRHLKRSADAIKLNGAEVIRRYGQDGKAETLAWVRANLAYAELLMDPCKKPENQPGLFESREYVPHDPTPEATSAQKLGKDDPTNIAMQKTMREYDVSVKELKRDDSRFVIMQKYIDVVEDAGRCKDTLHSLDSIRTDGYTLRNNALMEEQVQKIYAVCKSKLSKDQQDKATERETLSKSLQALIYFQTATEDEKRPYFERRDQAQKPLRDIKKDLRKQADWLPSLGLGFLDSASSRNQSETYQEITNRSPNLCRIPETFTQRTRKELITRKELTQRARSLCAKTHAMACPASQDDLKIAERASIEVPEDPYLRANLGIVRLKLARANALEDLRLAVQLNTRDPQLRYLLGYAALMSPKTTAEGKREMHYGSLLDPEGWQKIEKYFQDNSLGACRSSSPINDKPQAKRTTQSDSSPPRKGGEEKRFSPLNQ